MSAWQLPDDDLQTRRDHALSELAYCIDLVTLQGGKDVPAEAIPGYLDILNVKLERVGFGSLSMIGARQSATERKWAQARIALCAVARDAVRTYDGEG
jgi:hypothetical protein